MKNKSKTVFNSSKAWAKLEEVTYNAQTIAYGLIYNYHWQTKFDMKVVQDAEISYGATQTETAVYFTDKAQAEQFINEWLIPYMEQI